MSQLRLLYIEDEADHRGLLVRLLDGAGWQVKTSSSFEEALPLLQDGWPQLLLMDLQLGSTPAEAGFKRLELIKKQYPLLPVAVTSVSDFPRWIQKVHELGAAAFIRKPVDIEMIDEQLRQLVEETQAGRLPASKQRSDGGA